MTRTVAVPLVAALLSFVPRAADACGNVTHAWITFAAKDALPDGPLKTFLADPALEDALRNGTLFPDGGYPIGDDYGELAHWEPFQDRYLAWIRSQYTAPWSGEAARHVAFFLGMASHGMADQFYDAVFMEISKQRDPGWHDGKDDLLTGFDSVTDFHWASLRGPGIDPPRWFPGETFVGLYAEHFGHTVTAERMQEGADLVGTAIVLASEMGKDQYFLLEQEQRFPWAFTHMDGEDYAAPREIARAVAAYWQVRWDRLHGGDWTGRPVLLVRPSQGAFQPHLSIAERESRLSVVFSRGLSRSALDASSFTLTDDEGNAVALSANLFYREASHVVNLTPATDLVRGRRYTLAVAPGVQGFDGSVSTAGASVAFFAGDAGDVPGPDVPGLFSCGTGGAAWLALLLPAGRRRRKAPLRLR